jgi:hypothetical protein
MKEPYAVWRFDDAPEELRRMSTNGGDEDWIVEIPPGADADTRWIEATGCCDVALCSHPTRDGWTLAIGVHA